jgi:hypothetical protein
MNVFHIGPQETSLVNTCRKMFSKAENISAITLNRSGGFVSALRGRPRKSGFRERQPRE